MLLDVRPNDQSFEIEVDPQTVDWHKLMRILQSNYLEIHDTIIQAANRNINTEGLGTKRFQKAYKNLVINGGRGIYDLNFIKIDKQMLASKYAVDAGCKNICIFSIFQQMEKWEKVFTEKGFSVENKDVLKPSHDAQGDQGSGNVIISSMLKSRSLQRLNFDFVVYDNLINVSATTFPTYDTFSNLIFMHVDNSHIIKEFALSFAWNKQQRNTNYDCTNEKNEFSNMLRKIRLVI